MITVLVLLTSVLTFIFFSEPEPMAIFLFIVPIRVICSDSLKDLYNWKPLHEIISNQKKGYSFDEFFASFIIWLVYYFSMPMIHFVDFIFPTALVLLLFRTQILGTNEMFFIKTAKKTIG